MLESLSTDYPAVMCLNELFNPTQFTSLKIGLLPLKLLG